MREFWMINIEGVASSKRFATREAAVREARALLNKGGAVEVAVLKLETVVTGEFGFRESRVIEAAAA